MSQHDTHFSIYTVLIALVLATIVIVPIVSAAEKQKDSTTLSIETAAIADVGHKIGYFSSGLPGPIVIPAFLRK